LEISFGLEDLIRDHNTCFSAGGAQPSVFTIINGMVEGFQNTNNVDYIHGDANGGPCTSGCYYGAIADWSGSGTDNPFCSGAGKFLMDCAFNGVYNFASEVLIPGYTSSNPSGGFVTSQSTSGWTSAWTVGTTIPTASAVPARLSAQGWRWAPAGIPPAWPIGQPPLFDLRFSYTSPNISGAHASTDGLDIGADVDQLEDALGWIKNVRALSIATTSASISFHAPDLGASCVVGYGTNSDLATWTQSGADTSGSQERSIALSGLTTGTAYQYQVWCSGTAPTSTRNFRTL
jgi:hypothetical protein